ncbi:MAG: DUF2344 domain-containing protein, partial [Firmicutes bacterium]|nr:DUF2344 domain-containing protein [Bacillota bacterium]
PLPLGVTADQEYGELYLRERVRPQEFAEKLNRQLPPGLFLTGAGEAEAGTRSLSAVIDAALYQATRTGTDPARGQRWREAVENLLARPEIKINRGRPGKASKLVDIRPYIYNLTVVNRQATAGIALRMLLQVGSRGGVSPFLVLQQLVTATGDLEETRRWRIHRRGLYIYGEELILPLPRGGNYFWIRK